jgi:hypothetical protein
VANRWELSENLIHIIDKRDCFVGFGIIYVIKENNEDIQASKQGISNYDEAKVRQMIAKIKELCDWAIKHGYERIYVA